MTVRACLVEQNQLNVFVAGSEADIDATVIRSTAQGTDADGVGIEDDSDTTARAKVTMHACLVEQSHRMGIFVSGSDATIETTVVRSNLPDAQGMFGRGINVQNDSGTNARANVTVRACIVEQNYEVGVLVEGSARRSRTP